MAVNVRPLKAVREMKHDYRVQQSSCLRGGHRGATSSRDQLLCPPQHWGWTILPLLPAGQWELMLEGE